MALDSGKYYKMRNQTNKDLITLVDLLHKSIFFISFNKYSYGAHVISAMATELNDVGFGKIDRLTLLDPGCKVTTFTIDGKQQYGLIHKVKLTIVK